jgi:hypothetical protein
MKKLSIFFIAGLMLFAAPSCNNFESINTDPNNPTEVPSGLLIADAVRLAMNNMYSTFVGGDMGACWAQQWAKVQYNDEALYQPRVTVLQATWEGLYEDVANDSRVITRLAAAEGNAAMEGVGLTLNAWAFATIADMWGPVPFSEALQASEGNFTPAYDDGATVYAGVLDLLDQAEAKFFEGTGTINSTTDILYGGDASKWRRFANSLKFRVLMRISGVESVGAQLQELLARPMFQEIGDEAALAYLANQPNANPIYETIVFGTRGEFKLGQPMELKLRELGGGDPRLEVYAQENDAGEIRGKPAGINDVPNEEWNYANVSPIGTFYLSPTLGGHFMSYSQLMFLIAEAAERGLVSGPDAETYYNEGIRSNMIYNGITDFDAIDAYLAHPTVAYGTNNLRKIGEQMWVALFCQGIEAWTEWRRTGFPALEPALEAVLDEIPSRWTYPAIEQSINAASYDAAVATLQDGDALTSPVYWMD